MKDPAWVFCNNHRKRDRAKGRAFALTLAQVRHFFSEDCKYCGRSPANGIDRTDSKLGHTMNNSVPCCIRCNLIKGNVSPEAWAIIAPSVRQAFQLGLL